MIAKLVVVLTIFAIVQAGHEAPPPKAHTYNVPTVSKVSYPGPTEHKSVETYSGPSIEKTTTITRTITAPLNAPAERQISYAAPSGPIGFAASAPVANAGHGHGLAHGGFAAPVGNAGYSHGAQLGYAGHGHGHGLAHGGFAAPVAHAGYSHGAQLGYAGHGHRFAGHHGFAAPVPRHHHLSHGYAAAPIAHHHHALAAPIAHHGYAQPQAVHAAPQGVLKAYSEPTLTLESPALGYGQGLGAYTHGAQGLGLATTYSAPALGYSLGGQAYSGSHGAHGLSHE